MKSTRSLNLSSCWGQCLTVVLLFLCTSCSQAQNNSYKLAQSTIDPKYQDQVFWIKASGAPDQITEWSYYFYDPSTSSKARLVKIVAGRIDRVQPVEFNNTPNESLVFDPKLNKVSAELALQKARAYANDKQIKYDAVKMQLRRPSSGAAPVWHVGLYQGSRFAGTALLNDSDGSVVSYQPTPSDSSGSSSVGGFAHDVESTFRGIGGDLQEFFTGERTVDK